MTATWNKFLIIGFTLSVILACSGSTEDKKLVDPVPAEGLSDYNTKSCEFGLDDGETPDFSALQEFEISISYFNKEYNHAFLSAVLASNIRGTLDFVNKTGTTVYKSTLIKSKLCSRPLFEQASPLPGDLESFWTKVTGATNDSEGILLGLYLPKVNSIEIPSLRSGAAIIVRQNTNRWTLVHEFMHHLFTVRATEQGYDETRIENQFFDATEEIKAITQKTNLSESEMALQMVSPFLRFAEAMDSRLLHSALEEMAIEATLKNLLTGGRLKFVPTNSNWYIVSSASKALEGYKIVEDLASSLLTLLDSSKVMERRLIGDILGDINYRKSAISSLKNSFPEEEQNPKGSYQGIGIFNFESYETCSHTLATESTLKEARKINYLTSFLRK